MKYSIRRALVGILSIPFVAGAYTFVYLALVLLGAEPGNTLTDVYATGINIAIVVALMLTFYPQIAKVLDKVVK